MNKTIDSLSKSLIDNFSDIQINDEDKDLISVIMTHGLIEGTQDTPSINAIKRLMTRIHGYPIDLVVYRSGNLHPKRKPYLSASLSKEISNNYRSIRNWRHRIVVKAGAPFIPLSIVNPYNMEFEIILDTSRIHKTLFGYIYK